MVEISVFTIYPQMNDFVPHVNFIKIEKIQIYRNHIWDEFLPGWVLALANGKFECCRWFWDQFLTPYTLWIWFSKMMNFQNFHLWVKLLKLWNRPISAGKSWFDIRNKFFDVRTPLYPKMGTVGRSFCLFTPYFLKNIHFSVNPQMTFFICGSA